MLGLNRKKHNSGPPHNEDRANENRFAFLGLEFKTWKLDGECLPPLLCASATLDSQVSKSKSFLWI